jgi:hypothetical protein
MAGRSEKQVIFFSFWSFVIVTLMPLLQMKTKSLLMLKQHSHYTTCTVFTFLKYQLDFPEWPGREVLQKGKAQYS